MEKVKFVGLFYDGTDNPPARKDVVGVLCGRGLAVTSVIGKTLDGKDTEGWNVSHISSGHRMFPDYFKTRKIAIEAAKEVSRDVDWSNLKTVEQVNENHLAVGAYQRVLGKLKCNYYGIYTGWKY